MPKRYVSLYPIPLCKLLAAIHTAVCAVQAEQGEHGEELRVLLLLLMTEIIAQAGKVGPQAASKTAHNQCTDTLRPA